ncbi:MAG: PD40 domain-containing protein [Paludibacteraceae bacterium]|nr:PD40 domain-containing protein [Paludibacteraceae bacterium]
MKKLFLALAVAAPMIAAAQVLEVQSLQKINTPENVETKIAGISPAGDYLLLTTVANDGLIRYDLATGKTTELSKAPGAGYNVKISKDGSEIAYRETTIDKNRLRRSNILRQNFASGKRQLIAKGQRDLTKMDVKDAEMTVTILDRHIALTRGTQTTMLAPCGEDKSYIWPSISPDGTKLCFYVTTGGCYVSDIDGSNPQFIAFPCRAAKWYNSNVIVGMADEDDGERLTASSIVAYSLDGQKQVLTDKSMMAVYPQAVEGAIVFSTEKGETYLLKVK